MTAKFALHLDHDGIALYREGGADPVAATAFDDPDFGAALVRMRGIALNGADDAAPGGADDAALASAQVDLVLPDSQILYTEVAASGLDAIADAARVEKALDGATPYDLHELIYDWQAVGNVLHIAVVARETLEEARAFSVQQGFAPGAVFGAASDGPFPGRPSFSSAPPQAAASAPPQDAAPTIPKEAPTPDDQATPVPIDVADAVTPPDAVKDVGEVPAKTDAPLTARPDTSSDTQPMPAPAVPGDWGDPVTEAASQEADTTQSVTANEAVADRSSQPIDADTGSAPPPKSPEPQAAPAGQTATVDHDPTDGPESPDPEPAADDDMPPVPAFASIRAQGDPTDETPRPSVRALVPDARASAQAATLGPVSAPPPQATGPSRLSAMAGAAFSSLRRRPKPRTEAPARPTPPAPRPASATMTPSSGTPSEATAPAPPAMAAKPARQTPPLRPAGAAPSTADEAKQRPTIKRAAPATTLPAPTGPAPSRAADMEEADSLTVFGARRTKAETGRPGPRYLGLVLTLTLLGMMVLVAMWSLWFGEQGPDDAVALAPPPDAIEQATDGTATITPLPDADVAALPPVPNATESAAENAPPPAITPLPEADAPPMRDLARLAGPTGTETPPVGADVPVPTADTEAPPAVIAAAPPASGEAIATPSISVAPTDPAQALAAYAASGIWQATPSRGAAPAGDALSDLTIAAIDPARALAAPPALPGTPRRDARLPTPTDPLPPGTVLGPDGLVLPTQDGALAPGGFTLFTGRPPIIPPRRGDTPDAALDAAEELPAALPADPLEDARPRPRPATEDQGALDPESEDAPALTDSGPFEASPLRPRGRPEGTVAPLPDGANAEDRATIADPDTEAPDEAIAESAPADAPSSAAPEPADPALAGARPLARPDTLAAQAAELRAEAARAEEVAQQEAAAAAQALAEAEAARLAAIASATRLAVPASPEPRARPSNIAQITARAQRQAEQENAQAQAAARAASTPERPAAAASTAVAAPAPQRAVPADDAPARGPVVARSQRVTPPQATPALVARQATERNALRMRSVTLIGVYGTPSQRRALVRLPSGRYVKVQVGDRLDGGQVAAIGSDAVRYVKRGRDHVLEMPSG